jgi:hypothetical protein
MIDLVRTISGAATMISIWITVIVAALLPAMTFTPVFAQAANSGAWRVFSFYYHNLDVLNGGVPTPAARLSPEEMQASAARESGVGGGRPHRIYRGNR